MTSNGGLMKESKVTVSGITWGLCYLIFYYCWMGFVFMRMYNWFLPGNIYHPLSFQQSVGIILTIRLVLLGDLNGLLTRVRLEESNNLWVGAIALLGLLAAGRLIVWVSVG